MDAMNCGRPECFIKTIHTHETSVKEPTFVVHSCNEGVIKALEAERDGLKESLKEWQLDFAEVVKDRDALKSEIEKDIAVIYKQREQINAWKAKAEKYKKALREIAEHGEGIKASMIDWANIGKMAKQEAKQALEEKP